MKFAFGALFSVLLISCTKPSHGLPSLGEVPDFSLTAQTGQPFRSSEQLRGSIWVADFIYTTCPDVCPRMTSQMHQVQEATFKTKPAIKLVSFTVDPANDTPPVLAKYAADHHASPEHWVFLTGAASSLQKLDRDDFKLGSLNAAMQHSSRFVLVDQKMIIRGYYDTSEPDAINRLVRDLHTLDKS